MRKIGEYLLGALLGSALWFALLATYHAVADQSSLSSPTTGTVSGLQLTNNYNSALNAVNTCNSGTAAPTNQLSGGPSLGNCWLDTSSAGFGQLKIYDGTSWLVVGVLDTTNHIWMPVWGGGNTTTVTVAGGATTDLCGSPGLRGATVVISGSATITSFATTCPAGTIKNVIFNGTTSITSSGTLQMPGGVSGAPAAGDNILFITDGTNWFSEGYYARNSAVTCAAGTPSSSFAVRGGIVVHC